MSGCLGSSISRAPVCAGTYPAVCVTDPLCGGAGAEAGAEGDQGAAGPPLPFHELPEAGGSRARAAVLPDCR